MEEINKIKNVIMKISKRLSYIIKGSKMENEIEMLKAENEALKQKNTGLSNKNEELKSKDSKIIAENKDLNYFIKEVFPEILVTFEDNTTAAYTTFLKVIKRDKFSELDKELSVDITKDTTTKEVPASNNAKCKKIDDRTFINA